MGLTYLDSCIVIYLVEQDPVWAPLARDRFANAGDVEFCYSPLVRMECFVRPLRLSQGALLERYRLAFSQWRLLAIPEPVFDRAARLRADHRLRTPDALHLACALHHGCEALWTNDARLSTASDGIALALGPAGR